MLKDALQTHDRGETRDKRQGEIDRRFKIEEEGLGSGLFS